MIEEWLVRDGWCDVFLMCRGGVFNAHRTVLASVSPYLRCILVSHSEQHNPIYIALPDFDWEIMSAVLNYVYNGEISIPLEHLRSFFDIIDTLKIFIDKHVLEEAKEYLKDINGEELPQNNLHYQKNVINDEKIVKLKFKSLKCLAFENKEQNNNKKLLQEDKSENTHICNSNKAQEQDKDFKNSLLRDSFNEMCSQNGNSNRPSPNVPTITNERYLELVSEKEMNGNNNIMHNVTKNDTESTTNAYDMRDYVEHKNNNNIIKTLSLSFNSTNIHLLNRIFQPTVSKEKNSEINKTFNNMNFPKIRLHKSYDWLDLSQYSQINNNKEIVDNYATSSHKIDENLKVCKSRSIEKDIKVAVKKKKCPLNKVLASPWIPRQPRSFRPFKNKRRFSLENTNHQTNQASEDSETQSNDKNNNIPESVRNSVTEDIERQEINTAGLNKAKYESEISSSNEESEDSKKQSTRARHVCGECGKCFSQLRNYKYHISVHRGTKEFAATCPVCGKYFNDRGYLSSHLKIHRNRKEYQCSHCPKSFNQRVAYNMHIRIHTGVKPHVCDQCGKAFSRKMLLKQHKRTHSGERPYACSFCDKRFADRSNMTLHMRLHSGVKPFACTMCPKTFTKKHHLKTHLNFHTGAKPYSCPRCSMAFSQSSNMRTHLKKCTAEPSST